MRTPRVLRMSYLVASIAGIAFFVLSVTLLGVWPSRVLDEDSRRMTPEHALLLSPSEMRGREIYSREGCAYCHTQQVRYLEADMSRFGAPTLAWETRWDYPHLWGTRRIGPDLSREGGIRPADWQLAHLYSPRVLVADSVMPAYPALFDGSALQPKQEALDLVAYLESLGRARQIAGAEGEARARKECRCEGDEMAMMAFHSPVLNASAAKPRRNGATPQLPTAPAEAGRELYRRDCSSCHGEKGAGDGPGAALLHPRPKNLARHEYSLSRLSFVLENGVAGTSMAAWRDYGLMERAALAQAVLALHVREPEPVVPPEMLELGERVYRANCLQCHGERGGGDGYSVAELRIVPANFEQVRPSRGEAMRVLREGIEGTQMAPWTGRLSENEIQAVTDYVRSLFGGGKK